MDALKVQSKLKFGQAAIVKEEEVSNCVERSDFNNPDISPVWCPIEFWQELTPRERHIHTIAYEKLGSSYTAESTQRYIKWKKAKA